MNPAQVTVAVCLRAVSGPGAKAMDPGDISKLSWTDPVMDGLGAWSERGEKGLDPFVLNSDPRPLGVWLKFRLLLQVVWGRTGGAALLTNFQVMPVQRTPFGRQTYHMERT